MTVAGDRGDVSITVKLPVLMGGLLALGIGIYASLAYRAVRSSTLAAATQRDSAVAEQLGLALRQSGRVLIAGVRGVADTAPVKRLLSGTGEPQAPVVSILRPPGNAGSDIVTAQVFDPRGRLRLAVGDSGVRRATAAATAELIRDLMPGDSGLVGRFLVVGDSVLYPVVAPSVTGGRIQGYVAVWRHLTATAQSRAQTSQLIGAGSHLYLGDVGDNIWTDLNQTVPPPPIAVTGTGGVLRYARPGEGEMIAVARRVSSAPWIVLVEFPVATVLAPAADFLRRSFLQGAVLLAFAVLVGWAASRRLTAPLVRLTRTAETLSGAAGATGEGDEIRRLARAFEAMVSHLRDAQRELERRVTVRTTQLQERNEELESFAYSISHDLRAPLRAMDGFSQALLDEYGSQLDATGRQYAERVQAGARRMDLLIRDLLAYSRMTRADIQIVPVPLEPVVKGAVAQVEEDARGRGARIRVDDALPWVMGHEATLTQVLMNLLANGLKFVPADRVPELRIRTEARDGLIRIWILDNGIGIAPEHHDRIFRVFERLHRQDEYPGTGIGLAIVRKGVERMGGRVGLESEPERGSSFWVELPRAEAP
ncbi:MAG TPA: ATP-binding protein [Gemmatimonadales bacterium]|nr:ATP-binding protein [Gemmatimonadales bacterium]